MKNYEAPQATVVDFENDYVVAYNSGGGGTGVVSPGLGDLFG